MCFYPLFKPIYVERETGLVKFPLAFLAFTAYLVPMEVTRS